MRKWRQRMVLLAVSRDAFYIHISLWHRHSGTEPGFSFLSMCNHKLHLHYYFLSFTGEITHYCVYISVEFREGAVLLSDDLIKVQWKTVGELGSIRGRLRSILNVAAWWGVHIILAYLFSLISSPLNCHFTNL